MILPFRNTGANDQILIVTHGGIVGALKKYLVGHNYQIHDSVIPVNGRYEVPNCSITEIYLPKNGPGVFLSIGRVVPGTSTETLENSTG